MALFFGSFNCLIKNIYLTTSQASISFKHQYAYTTPTFITEAIPSFY